MNLSKSLIYNSIYHWKDYESESKNITNLIQLNRPNAQTILDIGCGTAKHHTYLNKKFSIDGLDIEEDYIQHAQIQHPNGHYYCENMTCFHLPKKYDVIISLFSAIGYAKTLDLLHQTLNCVSNQLNPGGLVIIEPWITPELWMDGLPYLFSYTNEDLKICRMNVSQSRNNISILDFHFSIARKGGKVVQYREVEELGLFTIQEMKNAFTSNGLMVKYADNVFGFKGLYVGTKL